MTKAKRWAVLSAGMLLTSVAAALPQERKEPPRPQEPCPEITQAAIADYRAGRFGRLERLMVDADSPPAGARAVERKQRLDGVLEALYLDCEKKAAYIERRGGVADIAYWFGPFALD